MTQVWIMMKGELSEGGDILGVYADKDIAFTDFAAEARMIDAAFTLRRIEGDKDGSVYVEGGCDWLSLDPHTVIARPRLAAAPGPDDQTHEAIRLERDAAAAEASGDHGSAMALQREADRIGGGLDF